MAKWANHTKRYGNIGHQRNKRDKIKIKINGNNGLNATIKIENEIIGVS